MICNSEILEVCLDLFLYKHGLKNLVTEKTWFKSVSNPSWIDLFLTNQEFSLQSNVIVAICLPYFHKLLLLILKTSFSKNKPKKICYQNYENFNSNIIHDESHSFWNLIIHTCDKDFPEILNKNACLKGKLLLPNQASYALTSMRQAIMKGFPGKKNT